MDLGIVSGFLEAEIRTNAGAKLITDIMDKILFGQEEYFDWYGNVYGVEIRMDYSRVYNHYLEDEIESGEQLAIPYESVIETTELRELIDIWCKELKKFYAKKKS